MVELHHVNISAQNVARLHRFHRSALAFKRLPGRHEVLPTAEAELARLREDAVTSADFRACIRFLAPVSAHSLSTIRRPASRTPRSAGPAWVSARDRLDAQLQTVERAADLISAADGF